MEAPEFGNARPDRAFVVQGFRSRQRPGFTVTVAGCHFPHPHRGSSVPLQNAIAHFGNRKVLVIADTNLRTVEMSSAAIMCMVAPDSCGDVISTASSNTCCLAGGFMYDFDRVIANFGSGMQTKFLQVPSWAIGAFHKGVIGTFEA
jgi:hypothetical protein